LQRRNKASGRGQGRVDKYFSALWAATQQLPDNIDKGIKIEREKEADSFILACYWGKSRIQHFALV
jgi:hypothetical protein